MAAAVLLLTGGGFVGVAVAGQKGAPPPVPATSMRGSASDAAAVAAPSVRGADSVLLAARGERRRAAHAPRRVEPRPTAVPVRLVVPSLRLDVPVGRLGVTSAGEIEVPREYDRVGWFARSPRPGDRGAAVLAGHVDSENGPAVFYHLSALQPGAEVVVERADGSSATFRVDRLATYAKDEFPTVEVYASNDRALRLITCGGKFRDGEYEDNVVVYATLDNPV
ncbi:MAG: class F sortase [Actinomycetota bacterium]|nr:class F sortase [Actinomycetota bacterium]